MFTKTMTALAAALILGAASAALASDATDRAQGGYRELGPGGFATQGINPAYHATSAAACKRKYKSYDPSDMTFLGKDGQRHPCPG
jgi:hypothetical protein